MSLDGVSQCEKFFQQVSKRNTIRVKELVRWVVVYTATSYLTHSAGQVGQPLSSGAQRLTNPLEQAIE
jgi:hypothetical protein